MGPEGGGRGRETGGAKVCVKRGEVLIVDGRQCEGAFVRVSGSSSGGEVSKETQKSREMAREWLSPPWFPLDPHGYPMVPPGIFWDGYKNL